MPEDDKVTLLNVYNVLESLDDEGETCKAILVDNDQVAVETKGAEVAGCLQTVEPDVVAPVGLDVKLLFCRS